MAERLLIVEDESTLRESLQRVFLREGYEVDAAGSAEEALEGFEEKAYDLVVTDILLPGLNGIELLKEIKRKVTEQLVIVMTAYASLETAIAALRAGAYDYILKPIIHEEIKRIIRNALNVRSLRVENLILKKQIEKLYDFENIIGESQAIKDLIDQVKKISDANSNILVLGETGTGKELFTRAIHFNSSRRNRTFVPINCSAIPEHLLESELFGHVKGAFTGASQSQRGLLEEADGGTVFLDEIADLSPALQAKLLRVIDDHEVRPVGSTRSRKVDIRIIAATNKDLQKAVKEGLCREDLYYRLNVVTLTLPPLRDRREDIPLLANHFLSIYAQKIGKPIRGFQEKTSRLFQDYPWPGNVRELQNIIERAVLITDRDLIFPEHLPEGLRTYDTYILEALDHSLSIENYTKQFIERYQTSLTEQKIAEKLGITRKALWEKRKKWGLPRP